MFARKTFREGYQARTAQTKDLPAPKSFRPSNVNSATVPIPDAQFTQELTALGGNVLLTQNPTLAVIQLLKSRGVDKIHLEPNTLDEMILRAAGIEFTHEPDPQILVGVTKAVCGLADTGSVLIADGKGDPLMASLLPEIHIAILKSSDIFPSLPDAMPLIKDTRAAVFITGPSRTADIEMTLTIGVHGPKELHIFLT
jgi:L-lactate utilization protein LutC